MISISYGFLILVPDAGVLTIAHMGGDTDVYNFLVLPALKLCLKTVLKNCHSWKSTTNRSTLGGLAGETALGLGGKIGRHG